MSYRILDECKYLYITGPCKKSEEEKLRAESIPMESKTAASLNMQFARQLVPFHCGISLALITHYRECLPVQSPTYCCYCATE